MDASRATVPTFSEGTPFSDYLQKSFSPRPTTTSESLWDRNVHDVHDMCVYALLLTGASTIVLAVRAENNTLPSLISFWLPIVEPTMVLVTLSSPAGIADDDDEQQRWGERGDNKRMHCGWVSSYAENIARYLFFFCYWRLPSNNSEKQEEEQCGAERRRNEARRMNLSYW